MTSGRVAIARKLSHETADRSARRKSERRFAFETGHRSAWKRRSPEPSAGRRLPGGIRDAPGFDSGAFGDVSATWGPYSERDHLIVTFPDFFKANLVLIQDQP